MRLPAPWPAVGAISLPDIHLQTTIWENQEMFAVDELFNLLPIAFLVHEEC